MDFCLAHGLKNTLRGLLTGLLTGLVITFFANSIAFATAFNKSHRILIFLLPIGALATTFLFKRTGESYRKVTTIAIDTIHEREGNLAQAQKQSISPLMGVVSYVNSMFSHFLGAAVGKEGVGVQLGLACSSVIDRGEKKLFGCNEPDYNLMCGASAAFAALFSAPIAGTLFGAHFASPRSTRLDAFLPCLVSAFTSSMLADAVGIHIIFVPEYASLAFDLGNTLKVFSFALFIGIVARLVVFLIDKAKELPEKLFGKSEYLQRFIPALALLAASLAIYAATDGFAYNGLSSELIAEAMEGLRSPADFFLKLTLILLSMAAGFQGGEVVPLLVLGALAGGSIAPLLALSPAPLASLGALAMLSGGTNLPLVCFALGLELFGYGEPTILFIACTTSFVASGRLGIYSHQKIY